MRELTLQEVAVVAAAGALSDFFRLVGNDSVADFFDSIGL